MCNLYDHDTVYKCILFEKKKIIIIKKIFDTFSVCTFQYISVLQGIICYYCIFFYYVYS